MEIESGESGKCDICSNQSPLQRKYYYYDIKCDCCNSKNDNHFEIVRHCKTCTPKPPRKISVFMVDIETISKSMAKAN